jgi:hypothetical protein
MLSTTDQEVLIRNSVFGLVLYGVVTNVPGANQFVIPSLAGQGADKFMGSGFPYVAAVLQKGTGTGAAPQGQEQEITAYDNASGTFTTNAFSVPVAIGDQILIIAPSLAGGYDAQIADDHIHNYEVSFGAAAAPVGTTHVADIESTTPFSLTAVAHGAGFGTAVQILGSSDTPTSIGTPPRQTGQYFFDLRRLWLIALSQTSVYIMRIIWGSSSQTAAQAIAAGQYTNVICQNFLGNCIYQESPSVRIPIGSNVWAQILNPNAIAATATFLYSLHEYPSLSQ